VPIADVLDLPVANKSGYRELVTPRALAFNSLIEALDLTTPAGRALVGLGAVFAEFEREIRRERVRAGWAHARRNGQRLGRLVTAARHAEQVRMF
jgi:putative DNA-invertase from lambdoid prophage Rac